MGHNWPSRNKNKDQPTYSQLQRTTAKPQVLGLVGVWDCPLLTEHACNSQRSRCTGHGPGHSHNRKPHLRHLQACQHQDAMKKQAALLPRTY